MSKTPFSSKVEILGTVYARYGNQVHSDMGWDKFFTVNDVGLPLAFFAWQDIATIKRDKRFYIDDTFRDFCIYLGLDPAENYTDVDQMFEICNSQRAEYDGE